jgi:hypothetical protein
MKVALAAKITVQPLVMPEGIVEPETILVASPFFHQQMDWELIPDLSPSGSWSFPNYDDLCDVRFSAFKQYRVSGVLPGRKRGLLERMIDWLDRSTQRMQAETSRYHDAKTEHTEDGDTVEIDLRGQKPIIEKTISYTPDGELQIPIDQIASMESTTPASSGPQTLLDSLKRNTMYEIFSVELRNGQSLPLAELDYMNPSFEGLRYGGRFTVQKQFIRGIEFLLDVDVPECPLSETFQCRISLAGGETQSLGDVVLRCGKHLTSTLPLDLSAGTWMVPLAAIRRASFTRRGAEPSSSKTFVGVELRNGTQENRPLNHWPSHLTGATIGEGREIEIPMSDILSIEFDDNRQV